MATENLDYGSLCIGTPDMGSDTVVTVPANTTIKAGTILARDTSTLKLVPYVVGGVTNGNGVPAHIQLTELVNSTGGAVDKPTRTAVGGRFNKRFLVVHAAGDSSTITAMVEDLLRSYGILVITPTQLSKTET